MASTVTVKNVALQTDDKEIKEFFSFCGKITHISVQNAGESKSATVTFEKETAAKTALLLNNTKLGDNEISVSGASSLDDEKSDAHPSGERDSDELTQEEKPRARILAEYLASGYVIGEGALHKALALDQKHGVSQRFLKTLQGLDKKYHATDRAKTADQSFGITQRANSILIGLSSYFEKASNTPTGQKIVSFYAQGSQQVADVYNEARRLAELKKQDHGGSAYKASGLEKIFGAETEKSHPAGAAPSDAPATESQQKPTAPAKVAGNEDTTTTIPK